MSKLGTRFKPTVSDCLEDCAAKEEVDFLRGVVLEISDELLKISESVRMGGVNVGDFDISRIEKIERKARDTVEEEY